jgi:hypothetical protein
MPKHTTGHIRQVQLISYSEYQRLKLAEKKLEQLMQHKEKNADSHSSAAAELEGDGAPGNPIASEGLKKEFNMFAGAPRCQSNYDLTGQNVDLPTTLAPPAVMPCAQRAHMPETDIGRKVHVEKKLPPQDISYSLSGEPSAGPSSETVKLTTVAAPPSKASADRPWYKLNLDNLNSDSDSAGSDLDFDI